MANISETDSIADIIVLRSDSVEIDQDTPIETYEKMHGTDETLLASFLQVLPVKLRGGQIEQNLAIFNFFLVKQRTVYDTKEYSLENFISLKISEIKEVEYIYFTKQDTFYEIWTIINKLDRELRKKIYDIEFNILQTFKNLYFDFHIICRNDRDINELCSSKSKMIFQRYS